MDIWICTALLLIVLHSFARIEAVYIWKSSGPTEDSILIKHIKNETHDVFDGYAKIVQKMKNYTLDEKCDLGLPFGIGFQWYNPYVDMGGFSSSGYMISGIFPHVTKKLMAQCCPKSKVMYGRHFVSIQEIEENAVHKGDIDIYFPLYALNGKASTDYKDYPFIPIVTAPRVVVLVPDRLFTEINPRMHVLVSTIFNAWPMLIFIIVSTMLAGLIVWFLDRKKNAAEFPPTFYQGAWEGIWWAFVTMTTVGYGDRSPRSPYARAFCIMWILVGIVLISLFTGLVTSALSASSTPVFNIAGSKIGAIRGSIEYQIGVGYNAEMKAYEHHANMLQDLVKTRNMHAVMIDNFILSANSETLTKKMKVRMEREFEIPITYGMALGDQNATKTYNCFKRYTIHHSHEIFEIISKKLVPVRNPTDQIRLEVAQAESLFYEDALFKTVVYAEVGVLIVMFVAGFLSEKLSGDKTTAFYHKIRKTKASDGVILTTEACSMNDIKGDTTPDNGIISNNVLQSLITEYDEYHLRWIQRVRSASKPPPPIIGEKETNDDNYEL